MPDTCTYCIYIYICIYGSHSAMRWHESYNNKQKIQTHHVTQGNTNWQHEISLYVFLSMTDYKLVHVSMATRNHKMSRQKLPFLSNE